MTPHTNNSGAAPERQRMKRRRHKSEAYGKLIWTLGPVLATSGAAAGLTLAFVGSFASLDAGASHAFVATPVACIVVWLVMSYFKLRSSFNEARDQVEELQKRRGAK